MTTTTYVESGGENARGIHATRLFDNTKGFTVDSLVAAAYDSYLPPFASQIPALVSAWDRLPAADALPKLLERDNARRLAREQLLEVAPQMGIEPHGPCGGRNRIERFPRCGQ